jgi:hypothetical protein
LVRNVIIRTGINVKTFLKKSFLEKSKELIKLSSKYEIENNTCEKEKKTNKIYSKKKLKSKKKKSIKTRNGVKYI